MQSLKLYCKHCIITFGCRISLRCFHLMIFVLLLMSTIALCFCEICLFRNSFPFSLWFLLSLKENRKWQKSKWWIVCCMKSLVMNVNSMILVIWWTNRILCGNCKSIMYHCMLPVVQMIFHLIQAEMHPIQHQFITLTFYYMHKYWQKLSTNIKEISFYAALK